MSDLNPTQRQEALDTIDDAMRVLGGMGRQGLNVRLQRLRKALSNPTSSVSTEGVADREAAYIDALNDALDTGTLMKVTGKAITASHGLAVDGSALRQGIVGAILSHPGFRRLTAINPDSPVEPDRPTDVPRGAMHVASNLEKENL